MVNCLCPSSYTPPISLGVADSSFTALQRDTPVLSSSTWATTCPRKTQNILLGLFYFALPTGRRTKTPCSRKHEAQGTVLFLSPFPRRPHEQELRLRATGGSRLLDNSRDSYKEKKQRKTIKKNTFSYNCMIKY